MDSPWCSAATAHTLTGEQPVTHHHCSPYSYCTQHLQKHPGSQSLTCPVVLLFLLCLRDAANKRSLTFGPSWRSVPKSKSSGAILQELPSPSWARAPTGPGESRRGGPDSRQRLDRPAVAQTPLASCVHGHVLSPQACIVPTPQALKIESY